MWRRVLGARRTSPTATPLQPRTRDARGSDGGAALGARLSHFEKLGRCHEVALAKRLRAGCFRLLKGPRHLLETWIKDQGSGCPPIEIVQAGDAVPARDASSSTTAAATVISISFRPDGRSTLSH
jgi:hypothetical protein